MRTIIGIYKITLAKGAQQDAFEETMKTRVFPTVGVGKQTRGGIVTAQQLLKNETECVELQYCWVVRWENQGGSPFGIANAPADPAAKLAAFGAQTTFSRYTLAAEGP